MPSLANIALLVSCVSSTAAATVPRTWLNASLPSEERLQAFVAQLNITQKLAMVQGDTVVRSVFAAHQHSQTLELTHCPAR